MHDISIVDSVASIASSIGKRAAGQFDVFWRDVMPAQGAILGQGYLMLVSNEPHPLGNVAVMSNGNDWAATWQAINPLLRLTVPAAAIYTNGVDQSVSEKLSAAGFSSHGAMPAMAIDIGSLAATTLPDGYQCGRLLGIDEAAEWTDVLAAGYEIPRGLARMLSPEVLSTHDATDARIQFFAVRHQGRIVATSMLYLADGLAGIYCVATLQEHRGKGLGAHITAEALRSVSDTDYRVGVLQSSEMGHAVYRKLGFKEVASIPLFIRMPA